MSALVFSLFLINCEKDGNGIPIKYYENVTGEGYIFQKSTDGTITPYNPGWIWIQAREKPNDMGVDVYLNPMGVDVDAIEVNDNGKYTCRFLEKKRPSVWAWGEWRIMKFYDIYSGSGLINNTVTITAEMIKEVAKKATEKEPQVIPIDTLWLIW